MVAVDSNAVAAVESAAVAVGVLDAMEAVSSDALHCADFCKVQTQQGRLFFLILAVSCIESASDRQVTFRYYQ